jgi:hypothetical protein
VLPHQAWADAVHLEQRKNILPSIGRRQVLHQITFSTRSPLLLLRLALPPRSSGQLLRQPILAASHFRQHSLRLLIVCQGLVHLRQPHLGSTPCSSQASVACTQGAQLQPLAHLGHATGITGHQRAKPTYWHT